MTDSDFANFFTPTSAAEENAGQDIRDTRELARSLMNAHGLSNWTFAFDNALVRAGHCNWNSETISLSAPLMALWTPAQRRDTILHEIAHALTPNDRGHGRAWQLMCIRIGADPTRTWGHNGEAEVPAKYLGTCPNGHTVTRMRLSAATRKLSCAECSHYYNPHYRFTWTEK